MRTREEIIADPCATPDEVRSLAVQRPLDVLAHPACPLEEWWEMAAFYTLEAIASPAYPLMTLEAPGRWQTMAETYASQWLTRYLDKLPSDQRERLAADAIEHVSSYASGWARRKLDPILAARRRLSSKAGPRGIISREWQGLERQHTNYSAFEDGGDVDILLLHGAVVRPSVALSAAASVDENNRKSERLWQWSRMLQYLRGEV